MSLAHHSSLTPPLYLLKIGPLFWARPPQPDIKVEIFQGKNRDFFSLKWFGIYRASSLSPIHSVLFENSSRMPSFFDNMFKFCMGYGSTNFLSYKKAKKKTFDLYSKSGWCCMHKCYEGKTKHTRCWVKRSSMQFKNKIK